MKKLLELFNESMSKRLMKVMADNDIKSLDYNYSIETLKYDVYSLMMRWAIYFSILFSVLIYTLNVTAFKESNKAIMIIASSLLWLIFGIAFVIIQNILYSSSLNEEASDFYNVDVKNDTVCKLSIGFRVYMSAMFLSIYNVIFLVVMIYIHGVSVKLTDIEGLTEQGQKIINGILLVFLIYILISVGIFFSYVFVLDFVKKKALKKGKQTGNVHELGKNRRLYMKIKQTANVELSGEEIKDKDKGRIEITEYKICRQKNGDINFYDAKEDKPKKIMTVKKNDYVRSYVEVG